MTAQDIADALGLGRATTPLRGMGGGGSSAGRYLLHTERGRWLVKTVDAPADWQRRAMAVAADLERAAAAAGVAMAAPVEPPGEAVGYWARLPGGGFARGCAWVAVTGPTVVDVRLAGWVGTTLARLGALDLPGDPTAEAAYPVHPVGEWPAWLASAADAGVLTTGEARELVPVVTTATERVRTALAERPTFRLAHRDISPANILVTARGPVLIDFDHAGPEVPWWEVVAAAFDLAWAKDTPAPDLPVVRAVLTGYVDVGGRVGPATSPSFAGMLAGTLGWLAYSVWLATGQRPCSAERRSAAESDTRSAATRLTTLTAAAEQWAADLARMLT